MIEAYVKLTKEKDVDQYELRVLGDDDIAVEMIAHIIIHDERGRQAYRVAKKYFKKFGTANGN
jgi:hypothetical protein